MPDFEFFSDIFEPDYCRWLLEDARTNLSARSSYTRSNFHWKPNIVRASGPVLVRDYPEPIAKFIMAALIKKGMISHFGYIVMHYA